MNRITLVSAAALSAVVTNAITVRFDDLNRGPADSLTVRGVKISKGFYPHRLGTVQGIGLGVEGTIPGYY
jgi:hypothetical protein